jgi:hypothetical protein
MRALFLSSLLLLPLPALAERVFKVTIEDQVYSVRIVTDEPSGHLRVAPTMIDAAGNVIEGKPIGLDEGPFEAAVRVGGLGDNDSQGAIRAMAAVCGFEYEEVKDWGAYGDPVWFDVRTAELVFWTDCPR